MVDSGLLDQTCEGPKLVTIAVKTVPSLMPKYALQVENVVSKNVAFRYSRMDSSPNYSSSPDRGVIPSKTRDIIVVENTIQMPSRNKFVLIFATWDDHSFDYKRFADIEVQQSSKIQKITFKPVLKTLGQPQPQWPMQPMMSHNIMQPILSMQPMIQPPMQPMIQPPMQPMIQPPMQPMIQPAMQLRPPMPPITQQITNTQPMMQQRPPMMQPIGPGVLPAMQTNPQRSVPGTQQLQHGGGCPPMSVSNSMMIVYPRVVYFLPPYGKTEMVNHICVQNCSVDKMSGIAFKVQVPPDLNKFYTVNPETGIVLSMAVGNFDIVMKSDFHQRQLLNIPEPHNFTVNCLPWPSKVSVFDLEMWANFNKLDHIHKQTEIVNVKLDRSGIVGDCGLEPPCFDVEGPELTTAHPGTVHFYPPYGKKAQSSFVKLLSKTKKNVAYKVLANKTKWYVVAQNKSVLPPEHHVEIEFEMNDQFTEPELVADSSPHVFQIIAFEWPKSVFDNDLWKEYERTKNSLKQIITLKVNVHPAGRDNLSRQPTAVETLDYVTVNPLTLLFSPASKKQSSLVTIKCTAPKMVAFKIQANTVNQYAVKPGKGVINPGESVTVTFDPNEQTIPSSQHKFHVLVLPWSTANKSDFDKNEFENMIATNKHLKQIVNINIDINRV